MIKIFLLRLFCAIKTHLTWMRHFKYFRIISTIMPRVKQSCHRPNQWSVSVLSISSVLNKDIIFFPLLKHEARESS